MWEVCSVDGGSGSVVVRMRDRFGIFSVLAMCHVEPSHGSHTDSPDLPSAAIRVPPLSLSLSTASSISTNFPLPSNNLAKLTHRALRFSVRAYGRRSFVSSLYSSSASREDATMRSNRCRAVMHSWTLTMICGTPKRWKYDRRTEVLPVAVRP